MQAFSLFSVLFLALIVYHKMAFNAVISRLSAIYNHREQTLTYGSQSGYAGNKLQAMPETSLLQNVFSPTIWYNESEAIILITVQILTI